MESNHYLNRFMRGDQMALQQPRYKILKEADISEHQLHDLTEVSSRLHVSRATAIILLRHCNWNISKLFDKWFDEEDEVRNKVGLFRNPLVLSSSDGSFTCGICSETFSGGVGSDDNGNSSTFCGHLYCRSCWAGYVSKSINNDGHGCLCLKCPHPCCGAAVGEDMIFALPENDADKGKFSRYLLRSYVEDSYRKRRIKWCPVPGCGYAVDFVDVDVGGHVSYDVSCQCSYKFCWNCNEEAHFPVKCDTVEKWMLKINKQYETLNWILVKTKPCPACKRLIEKDHGGNHMICPPCRFEFCWICLGEWRGSHSCNSYRQGMDESEKYLHYCERWVANHVSKQKALEEFQLVEDVYLKKLDEKNRQTSPILSFIREAWQEIIECRRVLKWSYAYGYYFPEHEHERRRFFEYLQGEAERDLGRFHFYAEVELEKHTDADTSDEDFIKFRTKLVEQTVVVRNYFTNLVKAMENDVSEISSSGDYWSCDLCTFVNEGSATMCVMCSDSPMFTYHD